MLKNFMIGLLFMALILAACAPEGALVEATAPVTPTLTAPPTVANGIEQATATKKPGCTVSSRDTSMDPTPESPIPPVSDSDWAIGPEDAYVTIIEYGDFQ